MLPGTLASRLARLSLLLLRELVNEFFEYGADLFASKPTLREIGCGD